MVTVDLRRPVRRAASEPKAPVASVPVGGRHRPIGTWIANTVGVVFTIVMAFPAYWMINTAFKPPNEVLTFTPLFLPEHPTFDNFTSALRAPLFIDVLWNSLIITISSVIVATVIGFLGALAGPVPLRTAG
jgi:N,N'-diacetylchitobiose transport system permease protein